MGIHGRGGLSFPLGLPAASRRLCRIISMCLLMVAFVAVHEGWALQRHTLFPEQSAAEQQAAAREAVQKSAPGDAHGTATGSAAGQGDTAQPPHAVAPGPARPVEPLSGEAAAPGHAVKPGEEAPHADEAHGPVLPEISPIPGVTFVETMIKLMDYELNERFFGWRPNDVTVGRFTDNVNNFQLGVLEAMRFTTMRLKDSLTRMGDADTYDPDLELALNLLMNRATLFWFPSAESSYGEAVQHLERFVARLKGGQRNFYYRVDNLRLLLASYKDLLGNVNRSLIVSPVSMFKTDDYFYYAKGIAHVYYEILRVVRVGYKNQLASTMNGLELIDEILHELHRVEELDPWIILDSDLDGFMANHRANLNAPLSEVTHLLGILSTF